MDTLKQYLSYLEDIIDTYSFQVFVVRDFNASSFDWKLGLSSISSHCYSKLYSEAVHNTECLHGLSLHNYSPKNDNLCELMFPSFTDFAVK